MVGSQRSHDIDLHPRIPAGVIRRSHGRRVLTLGAAGLGAAALAFVVVAGIRALLLADSKPPPAQTPAPAEQGTPSSFVGLKDGELVLASTKSGEVLRVIADRSVVGTNDPGGDPEPAVRPALTPDRSTVYFSTFQIRPSGEDRRLARVPLEGGEPEDLGMGFAPKVSPDGDRLAYRGACTEIGCGEALEILDFRTEEKTTVPSGSGDLTVGVTVWLPDGRLVVELVPTPMNSGDYEYRVIDPARPPDALIDAPSVPGPTNKNTQRSGLRGYHAPTGGVVVGQQRVERVGDVLLPEGPHGYVSVDPDTGEVLTTVDWNAWEEVHPDASGRHLLLLDNRGRVHISRDDGEPRLIAHGFSNIAW